MDERNLTLLTDLYQLTMMNGYLKNGQLCIPDKQASSAFVKLPPLRCRIGSAVRKTPKVYQCPFFRKCLIGDKNIFTEPNNFIIDIPIPSENIEKVWTMSNTAIFCTIPKAFIV